VGAVNLNDHAEWLALLASRSGGRAEGRVVLIPTSETPLLRM